MKTALALTFHRVLSASDSNVPGIGPEAGRYSIDAQLFDRILDELPRGACCTASEYARESQGMWLVLTFDDGYLTDYEVVFPRLKEKGLKAVFFVNTENIGRPGYLKLQQLREMADAGMEIGSHGLSHRYLTVMAREESVREITDSRKKLEEMMGCDVVSFAPVGGHYRKWMPDFAGEAGYRIFATMVPGKTRDSGGVIILRRNHIQAQHGLPYIKRLLNGDDWILAGNTIRYHLLRIPKVVLGMDAYDRFRKTILGSNSAGLSAGER